MRSKNNARGLRLSQKTIEKFKIGLRNGPSSYILCAWIKNVEPLRGLQSLQGYRQVLALQKFETNRVAGKDILEYINTEQKLLRPRKVCIRT